MRRAAHELGRHRVPDRRGDGQRRAADDVVDLLLEPLQSFGALRLGRRPRAGLLGRLLLDGHGPELEPERHEARQRRRRLLGALLEAPRVPRHRGLGVLVRQHITTIITAVVVVAGRLLAPRREQDVEVAAAAHVGPGPVGPQRDRELVALHDREDAVAEPRVDQTVRRQDQALRDVRALRAVRGGELRLRRHQRAPVPLVALEEREAGQVVRGPARHAEFHRDGLQVRLDGLEHGVGPQRRLGLRVAAAGRRAARELGFRQRERGRLDAEAARVADVAERDREAPRAPRDLGAAHGARARVLREARDLQTDAAHGEPARRGRFGAREQAVVPAPEHGVARVGVVQQLRRVLDLADRVELGDVGIGAAVGLRARREALHGRELRRVDGAAERRRVAGRRAGLERRDAGRERHARVAAAVAARVPFQPIPAPELHRRLRREGPHRGRDGRVAARRQTVRVQQRRLAVAELQQAPQQPARRVRARGALGRAEHVLVAVERLLPLRLLLHLADALPQRARHLGPPPAGAQPAQVVRVVVQPAGDDLELLDVRLAEHGHVAVGAVVPLRAAARELAHAQVGRAQGPLAVEHAPRVGADGRRRVRELRGRERLERDGQQLRHGLPRRAAVLVDEAGEAVRRRRHGAAAPGARRVLPLQGPRRVVPALDRRVEREDQIQHDGVRGDLQRLRELARHVQRVRVLAAAQRVGDEVGQ